MFSCAVLIAYAICFALGFGLGRVKNPKKLAVAQAELDKAKSAVVNEIKKVV